VPDETCVCGREAPYFFSAWTTLASITHGALIEREEEIAELRAALEDARGGSGRVVVIEGPAGAGKTRLLLEAGAMARTEETLVLEARGTELEAGFGFGVVHQLFDGLVVRSSPARQGALLAGAAGNARVLFGLGEPRAERAQPRHDPFALIHAVYWLCENLAAETPLALTIDDAHLGDAQSLGWLRFLADRIADLPVVVALTVLVDYPAPAAAELEAVRASNRTRVIRPRPISPEGSRAILTEVFGDPPEDAFLHACHEASGGNPFLLRELALALATAGVAPGDEAAPRVHRVQPREVAQHVAIRLARLPEPAQALARAAAVFGSEASLRHAAAVAELEPSASHPAADALFEAGLLSDVIPLRFAHPLVRAAVYAAIPQGARATAHRRAAALLALEDVPVEQVAAHLMAAERTGDQWAVAKLREAGRRALGNGAARSAVAYLSRALHEPPSAQVRPAVMRDLGSAEVRTGIADGISHLHAALEGTVDDATHAEVARELALALTTFGRTEDALQLLGGEIEALRRRDPEAALLLEADLLGYAQFAAASPGLLQDRLSRTARPERAATPGERAMMVHRAVAHSLAGAPLAEVADMAEEALGGGRLLTEQTADAPAFYVAVHILIDAERFETVDAALEQALDDARKRGSVLGFAIASTQRSSAAYLRGALHDADAEVAAALEAARQAGWEVGLPMTISAQIDVLVEQGRLDEAERALAEAGFLGEIPELPAFDWILFSRGRFRLARGDVEGGLDDLLRQADRQSRAGTLPIRMNWRTVVAPALASTGQTERARELAEEELRFARRIGTSRNLGMALRTLGFVMNGESGISYLRQAADVLERAPARLEYARTLVDLGAALRRSNRRSAARDALRAAIAIADRCGAAALAGEAAEELAALGVRAPMRPVTGISALTPSELRVARLAARGMSNPEIAQALFVTRKTIEKHLGNAYSKLGIASRHDLRSALRATGGETEGKGAPTDHW
jgi:DNA-binding CsgD family transcriptional regulator